MGRPWKLLEALSSPCSAPRLHTELFPIIKTLPSPPWVPHVLSAAGWASKQPLCQSRCSHGSKLTLGCWDTFGGCLFACWPHSHGRTHICRACLPSCHCCGVGGWGSAPLGSKTPQRLCHSLPDLCSGLKLTLPHLSSMGFRNGPPSAGSAWLLFGSTLIFVLKQELGTHKAKQISGTDSGPVMLPLASWIPG